MKKHHFFKNLMVFALSMSASICHSAEGDPLESLSQVSSSQIQDYEYIGAREQIKEDQEIYDEILRKNPKNPYHTHSNRLFDKLKNAFMLVRKYIQDAEVIIPNGTKQDQKVYLGYLDTLYKAACKINEDQAMTPLHFEDINLLCALIGTKYRHYQAAFYDDFTFMWGGENSSEQPEKKLFYEALQEGLESVVDFIKINMNEILKDQKEALLSFWEEGNTKTFSPMAIIYMDRDVPIGYNTFESNSLAESYPLFLSTFFPMYVPTTIEEDDAQKYTKHNVHFSQLQSLLSMLYHDFLHRLQNLEVLRIFRDKGVDLKRCLRIPYKFNNSIPLDKKRPLIAGLFSLDHELQPYTVRTIPDELFNKWRQAPESFDTLKDIIEIYQKEMQEKVKHRTTFEFGYKTTAGDQEYVLRWAKNEKGEAFIPLVKANGKVRFLPFAQDDMGTPVIILEVNPDSAVAKVRFSGKTMVEEIPYTANAENNMLLPENWTWMPREEYKYLRDFQETPEGRALWRTHPGKYEKNWQEAYVSTKQRYEEPYQKRKELYQLRQEHASQYVIKGYEDFWAAFKELAIQSFDDKK